MEVKAWEEKVIIPTYGVGKPEKNPMFLEKRVYQGSSGDVYPHPVIEKILDEKENKEWNAVFLENQYLKIMIMPELGGRVQMAFDKIKQRHFVYYNQVIKPALVGLTGPWISGGIEFNWPQHHRPSTFQPVDYCIEKNSDSSITVWCSELERMFRTRGAAGFTLYPDKAYLEIKVRLFNRTSLPQNFLWWANPAVKVNDEYQSVFPPDVHAVFDHGKRDVSEFPVAKGTYYKVDYSPGTDISRYKNIPVPTSFMATTSKYDFIGGYENDSRGGLLHVASHHISPGKKQWTWGNGDFGKAWDRNLTDEDGPYIELMCGVYTDNQPDFSWIMPGEEKSFSQYFMPYRDLGMVKNATKDVMVNLEVENGKATVKVYTTASFPDGKIILNCKNKPLFNDLFHFHPGTSYEKVVNIPEDCQDSELELCVLNANEELLISWKPEDHQVKQLPAPATAAQEPSLIKSNEQLYLTGLHLEQYRHATYDPRDYYLEALHRDPGDSRCNNALGLWYLRRGQFDSAALYFKQAVSTLTERNPNPIDGEPFYNLGLALRFLGNDDEAYNYFYKSVWNAAWQDMGYFQLASIEAARQKFNAALELVDCSIIRNFHNHKARHLKVMVLRKMHKVTEAEKIIEESLLLDNFNFGILYEKYLLNPAVSEAYTEFKRKIRKNIHNYIEFALDYAWSGQYIEAIDMINLGIHDQENAAVYPMAYYYKAWFEYKGGNVEVSKLTLRQAADASSDYCFPNQQEAVEVLKWAVNTNKSDYKAPWYLGNYWYHVKNYEAAIEYWEKSVLLNQEFPAAHRNLALAYFNKRKNSKLALQELGKAFELDKTDSRILMELDQLYKRLNYQPELRLQILEANINLVNERDDLYLERIALLNYLGEFEKAYQLISDRKFHPWEGGEGKVTGQYVLCLTEMAKKAIIDQQYNMAIDFLIKSQNYPDNLGEGKLPGNGENEQFFWLGVAHYSKGDMESAEQSWKKAIRGLSEPGNAIFYNDQQPDIIFYQGLALLRLKKPEEANLKFNKLIAWGKNHFHDKISLDYFAVSLPDLLIWDIDLNEKNKQLCLYLEGLGALGLGNSGKAAQLFKIILETNVSHAGCRIHLTLIEILNKLNSTIFKVKALD